MSEKDGLIVSTKKKTSLAVLSHAFVDLCNEIDDQEEVSDALVEKFMNVELAHTEKCDAWIYNLDQVKSRIAFLKERKKRIEQGYKFAQNLEIRMKEYVKYQIENNDIPFKGTEGVIKLQASPKKVDHNITVENKTVYNAVDISIADLIPDCQEYLKSHTYYSIDLAKIKADLKSGKELSFASLSKGTHVRIRA